MDTSPRYSAPDVLAKIVGLGWRARRVVEGTISGQHKSPFHGFSVEFAAYREYSPGDDLRRLDWRVFGRTDRHYVKLFEEESNLRCTLVMDCSASMRYKSDTAAMSKFDYGATLAASLATLLVGQQDPVGLALFDKFERRLLPSAATQARLVEIIEALEAARPDHETELGAVLQTLAGKLNKRGLIVIISDLLTDETSLLDGLSRLQYRGHEVVVFQVLDRDELEMPFGDLVQFKDIEGIEELLAEPRGFRQAYQAAMNDFLAGVRGACASHGVDHQLFVTDQDLGDALSYYLHVRGRIRAAHHAAHKPHRPR